MLIPLAIILVASFLLALRSMSDFHVPKELKKILNRRKIQGTFVFFKDKVEHYSSSESSESSV